jgi:hypothetical protein
VKRVYLCVCVLLCVCVRRYVFMMIFSGLLVSINSWPDYTRWLGYISFCK